MLCLKKLNRSQLPHPICPLLSKMRKSAEIRLALKKHKQSKEDEPQTEKRQEGLFDEYV